jgi:hypothetical protein
MLESFVLAPRIQQQQKVTQVIVGDSLRENGLKSRSKRAGTGERSVQFVEHPAKQINFHFEAHVQ